MRPLLAIVIALTLVAVAAAVGLFVGEGRSGGKASGPPPAASAAGPAQATVAASAPARGGRVLTVADAIRELDLIKPARAKRADDFSLTTPGSGKFRLFDHQGQVVLINFWATWCPP